MVMKVESSFSIRALDSEVEVEMVAESERIDAVKLSADCALRVVWHAANALTATASRVAAAFFIDNPPCLAVRPKIA